jgi:glycosyltransferase involved in cell wall biosynthesis
MVQTPRISIGMPTFNAAATIRSTVESLLAQTLGDFELIISDNASTDQTEEVVRSLVASDPRIRYVRQKENIGANLNYTFVARAAQGKYFKWCASSDWCAPTFLERCAEGLDKHDDAVLVAPRTRLFQNDISRFEEYAWDIEILNQRPSARLRQLIENLALNNAINGLIRTTALFTTRLIEPYIRADVVLMGHLALLGKFRLVSEPLFYRRMEASTATAMQDREGIRRHHYPEPTVRTLFQGSKRQLGWVRAVLAAPIPLAERMRCLGYVAKRFYWERDALLDDVRVAWSYLRSRSQVR